MSEHNMSMRNESEKFMNSMRYLPSLLVSFYVVLPHHCLLQAVRCLLADWLVLRKSKGGVDLLIMLNFDWLKLNDQSIIPVKQDSIVRQLWPALFVDGLLWTNKHR